MAVDLEHSFRACPNAHLPPSPAAEQDLLPFLGQINVLDLLGQHDWRLKQFFKDQRLRAMFTFQVCADGAGRWGMSWAGRVGAIRA